MNSADELLFFCAEKSGWLKNLNYVWIHDDHICIKYEMNNTLFDLHFFVNSDDCLEVALSFHDMKLWQIVKLHKLRFERIVDHDLKSQIDILKNVKKKGIIEKMKLEKLEVSYKRQLKDFEILQQKKDLLCQDAKFQIKTEYHKTVSNYAEFWHEIQGWNRLPPP